ncbi:Serine/threonine-protein kinase sik1 [Balamuthia mandrillaris]
MPGSATTSAWDYYPGQQQPLEEEPMEASPCLPGYDFMKKIGMGSDSEVWLARAWRLGQDNSPRAASAHTDEQKKRKHEHKKVTHGVARAPEGAEVAIKVIDKRGAPQEGLERIYQEVDVLLMLDHPHVLRMYECLETSTHIFIVMEYAKGGDLFDAMYGKNPLLPILQKDIQEETLRRVFVQIVSAVDYIRSKGIAHRDIKPENVMLDEKYNVKLGDFGLCLRFHPFRKTRSAVGSPVYASPEILQRIPYVGPELDVWGCGVLLYEMFTGTTPFQGEDPNDLLRSTLRGTYFMPSFISPPAKELIARMLQYPENRIAIQDVKKHPWVTGERRCLVKKVDGVILGVEVRANANGEEHVAQEEVVWKDEIYKMVRQRRNHHAKKGSISGTSEEKNSASSKEKKEKKTGRKGGAKSLKKKKDSSSSSSGQKRQQQSTTSSKKSKKNNHVTVVEADDNNSLPDIIATTGEENQASGSMDSVKEKRHKSNGCKALLRKACLSFDSLIDIGASKTRAK